MKSKVIQKKIKEFQPITVEITIESMSELKDLLLRLNLSQGAVIRNTYSYDDGIKIKDNTSNLWKELDILYEKLKED